jgi:heat-inducible transcriptional repressor
MDRHAPPRSDRDRNARAAREGGARPGALSPREREILRRVVQRFIQTAAPVGSKALAEEADLALSSASIRSTMGHLEAQGYLDHPHTSAGRVPTERGYRAYVDELMDVTGLTPVEARLLREAVQRRLGDLDAVARETSRLLGRLTHLLGVVLSPRLSTGTLERIDIVPLSSTRVMVVIAVRGGLARTVIAEVDGEVPPRDLDAVVQRLNERLVGLTLEEIRETGAERIEDLGAADRTGIVRLVLRDATVLFSEGDEARRAALGGAQHLVGQPEFQAPEEVQHVVELIENEAVVVHLLEQPARLDPLHPERAVVLIGGEIGGGHAGRGEGSPYSVVTAQYRVGGARGTVGVIGPTRMDYARAVALVEHVAALLSRVGDA